MTSKQKGSIAELAVAADLAKRGYAVAVPFGEYGDWDLLVDRGRDSYERVQVKYATQVRGCIPVRNRCHSVTAGRVTKTVSYNDTVDWLAVYEPVTDGCYYLHASSLGKEVLSLRLDKPRNGQSIGIKWAKDHCADVVFAAPADVA